MWPFIYGCVSLPWIKIDNLSRYRLEIDRFCLLACILCCVRDIDKIYMYDRIIIAILSFLLGMYVLYHPVPTFTLILCFNIHAYYYDYTNKAFIDIINVAYTLY